MCLWIMHRMSRRFRENEKIKIKNEKLGTPILPTCGTGQALKKGAIIGC